MTQWTAEQRSAVAAMTKIIKSDMLTQFEEVCQRTGLDPFAKQIYGYEQGGKLITITGIDGLRSIAERNGDYAGQSGPFFLNAEGQWLDYWITREPPLAAKVGVHRTKFKEPLYAVASWASYKGSGPLWTKMGDVMLAKCAEAQALRRAFPQWLGGVYAEEEMSQAGQPVGGSAATPEKSSEKTIGSDAAAEICGRLERMSLTADRLRQDMAKGGVGNEVLELEMPDWPLKVKVGGKMVDILPRITAWLLKQEKLAADAEIDSGVVEPDTMPVG